MSYQQQQKNYQSRSQSSNHKRQLEGEIRSIAGNKRVKFRNITLAADQVKINVRISPFNPRILSSVSRRQVSRLAKNIKENSQLMPVWAYLSGDKYLILDGSRRKGAIDELGFPLDIKLIEGDFTDSDLRKIADALAMSEGMSFIEMGAIWHRQIEEMKSAGDFESLRKFCKDNKLALSLVSDAVRAHKLPESLKNSFYRITTLGRESFKKLFPIADLMTKSIDNERILEVREFEQLLLTEIDIDMIIYNLEKAELQKVTADYNARLARAIKKENKLALTEDREPNVVDVVKNPVEITEMSVNKIVFTMMSELLTQSGLVANEERTEIDSLNQEPASLSAKTSNGVKINLVNVGQQKETFAIEINSAIANALLDDGEVSDQRINVMNDKLRLMDESKAKLLLSMIELMTDSTTPVPNNVTKIRKAS